MPELTQEYLKSLLHYDPDTGCFTWTNGRRAGSVVGTVTSDGYTVFTVGNKLRLAHRVAWLYVHGAMPPEQIDHINHERSDNRIANLRCATPQDNTKNRTKSKNNTSGITGVYWDNGHGKWRASIAHNGKCAYLGLHADVNAAIMIRYLAERAYGYHENHGR